VVVLIEWASKVGEGGLTGSMEGGGWRGWWWWWRWRLGVHPEETGGSPVAGVVPAHINEARGSAR
jgi:hypothetical protein